MSNLLRVGVPECPLCYKPMKEVVSATKTVFMCLVPECMISINKHDPAVGKWRDAEKRMPLCPKHNVPMRTFFRFNDGYVKSQCPKCRAEGKLCQVEAGKANEMTPQEALNWSVDPDEIAKEEK